MAARRAGILGVALVALGAIWWILDAREPAPVAGERVADVPSPASPEPAARPGRMEPGAVAASEPIPPEVALSPDVADTVARYRGADPDDRELALSEMAASDDPTALAFLIDELSHARGAQRRLLLQSVIDFGSRDAIPQLRELAQASESSEDKAALFEAADYLALPTLGEFRQGRNPTNASR